MYCRKIWSSCLVASKKSLKRSRRSMMSSLSLSMTSMKRWQGKNWRQRQQKTKCSNSHSWSRNATFSLTEEYRQRWRRKYLEQAEKKRCFQVTNIEATYCYDRWKLYRFVWIWIHEYTIHAVVDSTLVRTNTSIFSYDFGVDPFSIFVIRLQCTRIRDVKIFFQSRRVHNRKRKSVFDSFPRRRNRSNGSTHIAIHNDIVLVVGRHIVWPERFFLLLEWPLDRSIHGALGHVESIVVSHRCMFPL